MSDKELADALRRCAEALNSAAYNATTAGLRVTMNVADSMPLHEVGIPGMRWTAPRLVIDSVRPV